MTLMESKISDRMSLDNINRPGDFTSYSFAHFREFSRAFRARPIIFARIKAPRLSVRGSRTTAFFARENLPRTFVCGDHELISSICNSFSTINMSCVACF